MNKWKLKLQTQKMRAINCLSNMTQMEIQYQEVPQINFILKLNSFKIVKKKKKKLITFKKNENGEMVIVGGSSSSLSSIPQNIKINKDG